MIISYSYIHCNLFGHYFDINDKNFYPNKVYSL